MGNDNNKDPLEELTEIKARTEGIVDNVNKAVVAKTKAGLFNGNPRAAAEAQEIQGLVRDVDAAVGSQLNKVQQQMGDATAAEVTAENTEATAASNGRGNH